MPGSQTCNLIKEEARAQVFYCEFFEISKNTFFTEDLWATASKSVSEMLIFRGSSSTMFFKVSVLKNVIILEPLFNNKVADLLLQNTSGGCFKVFVAANTFLQVNMVFIADSRTGFTLDSLKKVATENFQISQENECVEISFLIELHTFNTDVFL